ncbi:hypothetical protein BGS_0558 [Beggiatoa sp. SS]|nr:hypothetical protein BGS_0558 [Beggiatoa sp. SS]
MSNKKQRITQSISLAEKMKQSHQNRITQLDKKGWYTQLKIPFHIDYPIVQTRLIPI